jgi:hypothetical protein
MLEKSKPLASNVTRKESMALKSLEEGKEFYRPTKETAR